jgi:hypothetical protein
MPLPIVGLATSAIAPIPAGSTTNPARQALDSSLVFYEGGGKWQEACARGTVFTGFTAAAGVQIPQYTATTQNFVLNNPTGSNKAAILKSWIGGSVAISWIVEGFAMLVGSNYAGAGAAAPTSTSQLSIVNTETGLLGGSAMQLFGASTTVVAATWYRPTGPTVTSTTAGNTPFPIGEDIDGSIILKPGCWIGIAANVATFGTSALSFTWAEVPVGIVN